MSQDSPQNFDKFLELMEQGFNLFAPEMERRDFHCIFLTYDANKKEISSDYMGEPDIVRRLLSTELRNIYEGAFRDKMSPTEFFDLVIEDFYDSSDSNI